MIKFLYILISLIFIPVNAYAVAGAADKYEVTMKKVELCLTADCTSPTEVAEGAQSVDIAGLTAGAEAAQFGTTSGLPMGTTYTHIRITLNRSFTLEGEVNVSGKNWCSTDSSAAGTATALHTGTLDSDGTPTDGVDQTLYISDADQYGSDNSIQMQYETLTYAQKMTVGSPTSLELQLIYGLTSAYTVGLTNPKIKVTFDTSSALGAGIDGGNNCLMWPEEPVVTIALTD